MWSYCHNKSAITQCQSESGVIDLFAHPFWNFDSPGLNPTTFRNDRSGIFNPLIISPPRIILISANERIDQIYHWLSSARAHAQTRGWIYNRPFSLQRVSVPKYASD